MGISNGTGRFVGPLNIETTATPPTDMYTLSVAPSTAPAYTQGVTLTGPGAQAWKDALPDRASNPYRKLILAEEVA